MQEGFAHAIHPREILYWQTSTVSCILATYNVDPDQCTYLDSKSFRMHKADRIPSNQNKVCLRASKRDGSRAHSATWSERAQGAADFPSEFTDKIAQIS